METWPSVLPLWRVDYSGDHDNAVIRTQVRGKKVQRLVTRRSLEVISVELILFGAQLPLFEYFVQDLLNEGQDFFTGSFIDNGTVATGNIRLVGGAYSVNAITKQDWSITCDLEVQRD